MVQIILPSENALETPAEGVGSASDRPRTPGSGERPGDDIPCPPVQENPRPSPSCLVNQRTTLVLLILGRNRRDLSPPGGGVGFLKKWGGGYQAPSRTPGEGGGLEAGIGQISFTT